MTWKNKPKDIKDHLGFVYIITHKESGRYYIGKKQFWSKRTLKPLKGKKRKRHTVVESDWKKYWGSSNKFNAYVKAEGKSKFTREMLLHCDSKFDLSYEELKLQMYYNIFEDSLAFNEIINIRLRRRK